MNTFTKEFHRTTKGYCDVIDLTADIDQAVRESAIQDGLGVVFVPGSTAAITTIEYESGVIADLRKAIERLAPQDMHYDHNQRWGDGNGFSHVRAALLGPSLSFIVANNQAQTGTWQQIVLLDFDNRGRDRRVLLKILGT